MVSSVNFGPAMVMHSHPSDVSFVMVNGEVVKKDVKMLRVDWDDLKTRARKSRKVLEERWKGIDGEMSRKELIDIFYSQDVLE